MRTTSRLAKRVRPFCIGQKGSDPSVYSRRIWARGIATDYSYDNWGNLTNTVYSDATPTVSLFYDAMGRQIEAHDAAGVTIFAYDVFGLLTNETVIGIAGANVIERCWDAYSRNIGYSLNSIRQSTLVYDLATGRLASMQVPSDQSNNQTIKQFSWSYLPGSDLKSSLAYPNGLSASWAYDANNQLLQVCNATPTNIISQYDYTYDAAGLRIEIARSGTAMSETRTDIYGYNIRNELISASKNAENTAYQYQYDDIGNRISSLDLGTNRTYTANSLNQYTLISNLCDSASLREEFIPQFDDDGNQTLVKTATGIWQVQYNGENRPVLWENVSTNSPIQNSSTLTLISMSYDRMGRRVTKNDLRFVYDGYLQIADNADNAYIWDCTENVATRPLVWKRSNSVAYYCHDGNKNVSEVIAVDGALAAHYEYAPFGAANMTDRNTAVTAYDFFNVNPFKYSSEYSDNAISLSYYNYRNYDAANGRWISSDPLASEDTYKYIYVSNNPFVDNDYLGLIEPCPKGFPRRYLDGKIQYRSLIDTDEFKTTNGCGAEGGASFPNSFINEHIVNFRDCCDAHDVCYGTCGRNKSECDHNLGTCMRKKCMRLFFMPLEYALCVGQADLYETVVAIAGRDAFESAQDKYCVWIDCCPEVYMVPVPQFTTSEVVNAINNFIQTP